MRIFMTTEQATKVLGISKRTFSRRYVETGLLKSLSLSKAPSSKKTRRVLYLAQDIERLMGEAK